MRNELRIGASPAAVFGYVTQPSRWHEWHPNSKSARPEGALQTAGDHFQEIIEIRPLAPLPPNLVRRTHYDIVESLPPRSWEARGRAKSGWLVLRYDIEPDAADLSASHFRRTLEFELTGVLRPLLPFLSRRMVKISEIALRNLKMRLESAV